MSTPEITIVEGIAHPETEATVQAKVDLDLTAGQDRNTTTIVSIRTTDHAHMIKDTIQTPETDKIHPIKNITTIDRDLEATHLLETMINIEIDTQTENTLNTKADQIVETTHFTQRLMLLL